MCLYVCSEYKPYVCRSTRGGEKKNTNNVRKVAIRFRVFQRHNQKSNATSKAKIDHLNSKAFLDIMFGKNKT